MHTVWPTIIIKEDAMQEVINSYNVQDMTNFVSLGWSIFFTRAHRVCVCVCTYDTP